MIFARKKEEKRRIHAKDAGKTQAMVEENEIQSVPSLSSGSGGYKRLVKVWFGDDFQLQLEDETGSLQLQVAVLDAYFYGDCV